MRDHLTSRGESEDATTPQTIRLTPTLKASLLFSTISNHTVVILKPTVHGELFRVVVNSTTGCQIIVQPPFRPAPHGPTPLLSQNSSSWLHAFLCTPFPKANLPLTAFTLRLPVA